MSELYVGLMSGTSMDGVDAVLAEIGESECRIHRARTFPFPTVLAERLRRIIETPQAALAELGALDSALGRFFAVCSLEIIESSGYAPADITAIGHPWPNGLPPAGRNRSFQHADRRSEYARCHHWHHDSRG